MSVRFFLLLLIALFAINASAEDESGGWKPSATEFDWLQLTSGEWLKGEIKSMYNETIEFDSDKLKLLSISLGDVKYLQSFSAIHVSLEGYGVVTGILKISDQIITVLDGDTARNFSRKELVSFTPAGDSELDLWDSKFSLSFNIRQGNTEQLDYSASFSGKRRTAESRLAVDYIGNISKTDAVTGALSETINNHRLIVSLDRYVSREFFYTPLSSEYYRDPFQNIDMRLSIGAGLGYILYDTSRLEWDINAGPSLLRTQYISVQDGEKQRVDSAAFSLGMNVDASLNSRVDFLFRYNVQFSRKDAGGYTHHMIATFENELTSNLDLDVSLVWDRISQPTTDSAGVVPQPDDYRLMLGVGYSF